MTIYPICKQLNVASGTAIVELLNAALIYQETKKRYPPEYIVEMNIILEALDFASNLSTASLPQAPFPAIDITDTSADKVTKIADLWRAYPSIGMQLHYDAYGTQYLKKGKPVVIQNHPVQHPTPLISPYLSATSRVFLLGEKSRLGVSLISGGNWASIKGEDYVTITGAVRVDVQVTEAKIVPIRNWATIYKEIPANTPTRISLSKSNRRSFTVQNAGEQSIWVGWGSQIGENSGNFIPAKGSYSMESDRYHTEAEFWAYSSSTPGLIVGQEGLI